VAEFSPEPVESNPVHVLWHAQECLRNPSPGTRRAESVEFGLKVRRGVPGIVPRSLGVPGIVPRSLGKGDNEHEVS